MSGADLHRDDHARAYVVQWEYQRTSRDTIAAQDGWRHEAGLVNGTPARRQIRRSDGTSGCLLVDLWRSLSANVRFWLAKSSTSIFATTSSSAHDTPAAVHPAQPLHHFQCVQYAIQRSVYTMGDTLEVRMRKAPPSRSCR